MSDHSSQPLRYFTYWGHMRTTTRLGSRTVVLIAAMLAAIPFLTTPTAAATSQAETAYLTRPFNAEYGNTYTRGQVTFYNRSVLVAGQHKAVGSSGCRYTLARALTASGVLLGTKRTPSIVCDSFADFSFTMPADVPGGAARVDVSLVHAGTNRILKTATVWRL